MSALLNLLLLLRLPYVATRAAGIVQVGRVYSCIVLYCVAMSTCFEERKFLVTLGGSRSGSSISGGCALLALSPTLNLYSNLRYTVKPPCCRIWATPLRITCYVNDIPHREHTTWADFHSKSTDLACLSIDEYALVRVRCLPVGLR